MRTKPIAALSLLCIAAVAAFALATRPAVAQQQHDAEQERLAVVWSSGDPDVAHRVCLMYTDATQRYGWFDHTKLIVWGPSARLLAADKDLQDKVAKMMENGVEVQACIVCADSYGVTQDLRDMGIEVKPMGAPLSELLKSDWHVITF